MAQYGNEINAVEAILQSIPTPNRINNNYARALRGSTKDIKNTDFVSGQKGAQDYIAALAGALNLGGAGQDVGSALAPSSGNSLVDRVMGQGAASLFSSSLNTQIQNASTQRNAYLMKLAQFLDASGMGGRQGVVTPPQQKPLLTQDQSNRLKKGGWSQYLEGATAFGGLPNFNVPTPKK